MELMFSACEIEIVPERVMPISSIVPAFGQKMKRSLLVGTVTAVQMPKNDVVEHVPPPSVIAAKGASAADPPVETLGKVKNPPNTRGFAFNLRIGENPAAEFGFSD